MQDFNDVLEVLSLEDRLALVRQAKAEGEETTNHQPGLDLGPMSALGQQILSLLTVDDPIHLDEVLARLQDASSSEIIATLFELEMNGRVRQLAGRRYVRVWS